MPERAASEMVEKVARAINEADVEYSIRLTRLVDEVSTYTPTIGGQKIGEFEGYDAASEVCNAYRMEAKGRAAITALREPSEAMLRVFTKEDETATLLPDDWWRAMIDAALSDSILPKDPAK